MTTAEAREWRAHFVCCVLRLASPQLCWGTRCHDEASACVLPPVVSGILRLRGACTDMLSNGLHGMVSNDTATASQAQWLSRQRRSEATSESV